MDASGRPTERSEEAGVPVGAIPGVAAIVPAAGRGVRLGPGAPKALRLLAGEPLLVHAVRALASAPSMSAIVVAAPPEGVGEVRDLLTRHLGNDRHVIDDDAVTSDRPDASARGEPDDSRTSWDGDDRPGHRGVPSLTVVAGGANRQESVRRALQAVPRDINVVLVHDAARPLVPVALVESVAAAVHAGADAVIPVLPVTDTVKQVDASGVVVATPPRSELRAVQTPQGFARPVLERAHAVDPDELGPDGATDDAGLVERLGVAVRVVDGADEALKVTRPMDLLIAEALLAQRGAASPRPSGAGSSAEA